MSISGKWKYLGRNLYPRVPESRLDWIQQNISNDDERIVKVIDSWIKDETIRPWGLLILTLDRMSETSIADKLMKIPKLFSYRNGTHNLNIINVIRVEMRPN